MYKRQILANNDSTTKCKKCDVGFHEDCVKKSYDSNIWSCPKCNSASLFSKTRKNCHSHMPLLPPTPSDIKSYRIVNVSLTPSALPTCQQHQQKPLIQEISNPEKLLQEYMNSMKI